MLTGLLKRLRDVVSGSFNRPVNLIQEASITLDPHTYGLERIRSVRLLPSIYVEGRDFFVEIEEDQRSARLLILEPEIFKGKEILLALRGGQAPGGRYHHGHVKRAPSGALGGFLEARELLRVIRSEAQCGIRPRLGPFRPMGKRESRRLDRPP